MTCLETSIPRVEELVGFATLPNVARDQITEHVSKQSTDVSMDSQDSQGDDTPPPLIDGPRGIDGYMPLIEWWDSVSWDTLLPVHA